MYDLEAILQHEGEHIHGGHYIMFLRTKTAWERRDDEKCVQHDVAKLPPYSPENVYILVFALQEKVAVLDSPHRAKACSSTGPQASNCDGDASGLQCASSAGFQAATCSSAAPVRKDGLDEASFLKVPGHNEMGAAQLCLISLVMMV